MNHSICINDGSFDTTRRVLRAASGIAIATVALTGLWSHPWAVFALSTVGVYLTCSAIVGRGLGDLFFKPDTDDTANVSASERAGRGLTAGVSMGTVLSGALLLDPVDVFVLMIVGVYTGMSALTGWDPVRALFVGRRGETTGDGLTRAIPAAVGHTGLGGLGGTADKRAA